MTVTLDGTQYLSAAVALPPTVLAAFTGATGTLADVHRVRSVSISAGGRAEPSLPATALLAFTGSTGTTGGHTVRDVAISAAG